ncbi:carbohydrate-binding module family 20 [Lecanosticta acicola]|uniref:alpha-amylase n=1 Tax=Lecanosticta acicola TaxID=111012 RepID=A0AAI8Z8P2_9PEZI|nr:carbohydrate-binding module family 20 [Lecanosticta acicola]
MATTGRFLCLFLAIVVGCVHGLTPAQWRAQSIYQVMTDRFSRTDGSTTASCDLSDYCGGTWQGLINRLGYIQQMGFTAVWISPVVKNPIGSTADGNSYHGYWAQDAYSVNPQFGTAADLKSLSSALHNRGMYLMVDVVPNHMASISTRANVNYAALNPFNEQSYFHTPCDIDYSNDTSIKDCWIGDNVVALPDLRTEDSDVQNMWGTWISELVSNYSIDGLRIDTAYQIDTAFWSGFQAAAGGIHTIGEVWVSDPNVMCPYQNYLHGTLNYPAYYWITQAFQNTSGSISNLVNGINQMKSTCNDVTLLGSFLENHDNPRFPSLTSDQTLIKNAITFPLLADGIPILYQGQEQQFNGASTPANREQLWKSYYNQASPLYLHIRAVNAIRARAIQQDSTYLTYNAWPIYSDSQTIAMRKGNAGKQIVSVYTNNGQNGASRRITLGATNSGFTAGQEVTEVLTCTLYTADSRGNLGVEISRGAPLILYPTASLSGGGICGL